MLRSLILTALILLIIAAPAGAGTKVRCTGDANQVQRLDITVAGEPATRTPPTRGPSTSGAPPRREASSPSR